MIYIYLITYTVIAKIVFVALFVLLFAYLSACSLVSWLVRSFVSWFVCTCLLCMLLFALDRGVYVCTYIFINNQKHNLGQK